MATQHIPDLCIVGAGPAGLATALYAARAGLQAVVLERRGPPLDKACGEGIMPPGVRALEALGVHLPASASAPFDGIRYLDGDVVAEGRFASGPGLGVRRTALAAALLDGARALGVEVRFGVDVRGWERIHADLVRIVTGAGAGIEARLVVGADGLHSRVRRAAGLALPPRGPRRFGVRRHVALAPWSRFVEVHWAADAEAYVTPVGPEEVGVAFLTSAEGPVRWDALLGRFPRLEARLARAAWTSPASGAGPFRQRVRRRFAAGAALVGDAAGYLDPLTGEGVTLGLASAGALVEAVATGRSLATYEASYRRLSRAYYLLTGVLLTVARRPHLRRRVVRALALHPAIFERFLAVNTGEAPLRALGLAPLVRLLLALALTR